jgi:glycosyltransferase involved in cell wall biosynthesis
VKILSSDSRSDLPHFNHYSYKSPKDTLFGKFLHTFNIYAYKELKKVLKEYKPDVVCVHTIGNASPAILLPLKNVPTVYMIHGPEFFIKSLRAWCFPPQYFKNSVFDLSNLNIRGKLRYVYFSITDRIMYKFGLKNVDVFVTLSNYMHKLLESDGIKNTYVSYGTKLKQFVPLKKDEVKNKLLYVGRLEIFKGVDYLIKAMPDILKKFPDTELIIAGDGREKSNLQKLSESLSLQNSIKFIGHVSKEEVEKLYRDTSVVVVPSVWDEAFGKIGVEAMSVGRPVIASDVGGISDWLKNGQNGYLIPPKDSSKISESVVRLFEDKELLVEIGNRAREISEGFDINIHVEKMEKIFEGVIESRKQKQKN